MKFDAQTIAGILGSMKAGAGRDRAARLNGVHPTTMGRWMKQGEAEEGTGSPYDEFATEVHRIEANKVFRAERTVWDDIDAGNVKSAMWMLERMCPDEYGPKGAQKGSTDLDEVPVGIDMNAVTEALRLVRERKKVVS